MVVEGRVKLRSCNCVLSGVAELGQGFFTQKAGDLEGFEGRKLVSEVFVSNLEKVIHSLEELVQTVRW